MEQQASESLAKRRSRELQGEAADAQNELATDLLATLVETEKYEGMKSTVGDTVPNPPSTEYRETDIAPESHPIAVYLVMLFLLIAGATMSAMYVRKRQT